MKYILSIALILGVFSSTIGQEQRIPFKKGEVVFFDFGNLSIEGYDGTDIIITEHSAFDINDMSSVEGMKVISSKSQKSTPKLTYRINKNEVEIDGSSPWRSYHVKVPRHANVRCKSEDPSYSLVNWDYDIKNIDGEVLIYVMELVDVKITDVNGSTSVLTHGNITYDSRQLNKDISLSLDSYRGSINVIVPGNSPLSVNLAAKKGNIYSDFNINNQVERGEYLLGTINNGGTALKINAEAGGNIYIRKK